MIPDETYVPYRDDAGAVASRSRLWACAYDCTRANERSAVFRKLQIVIEDI